MIAALSQNSMKSGIEEEDIEVEVSPTTLELRFTLKGNEKVEVAGFLQETVTLRS